MYRLISHLFSGVNLVMYFYWIPGKSLQWVTNNLSPGEKESGFLGYLLPTVQATGSQIKDNKGKRPRRTPKRRQTEYVKLSPQGLLVPHISGSTTGQRRQKSDSAPPPRKEHHLWHRNPPRNALGNEPRLQKGGLKGSTYIHVQPFGTADRFEDSVTNSLEPVNMRYQLTLWASFDQHVSLRS